MSRFALLCCLVLALVVAGASLGLYKRYNRPAPPPPERIRIGMASTENGALVYVASELGLFAKHGLDVSVKECPPGYEPLRDLEEGVVDLAGTPELALVSHAFSNDDMRVVASIATSHNIQLVARRDRGIATPSDLRGKTIAVSRGTTLPFFLDAFLAFNGILPGEVHVVNLSPSQTVKALVSGRVDAAMAFGAYAYEAKSALGSKALFWDGQNGQDYYYLLVSNISFVEEHKAGVERLLKALIEAQRYVAAHPDEARRIVEGHLGFPHDYEHYMWGRTKPKVSLSQELLIRMEDEGRWYRKKAPAGSGRMPNFYTYLYIEGLDAVDRQAVSVIH